MYFLHVSFHVFQPDHGKGSVSPMSTWEISVSPLSGATVPMLVILLLFLLGKTNLLGMNSIFLSYYIPLICKHWR